MAEVKVINFMGQRKIAATLSILLLVGSVVSLAINGLQFGLDFTGGTQIEVGYSQTADLEVAREVLAKEGLEKSVVVYYGADTDVLIRTQGSLDKAVVRQVQRYLTNAGQGGAAIVTKPRVDKERGDYAAELLIEGAELSAGAVDALFPVRFFGAVKTEKLGEKFSVLTQNGLEVAYTNALVRALSDASGADVELRRSEFVGPQVGEELRDDGGLGMLFALVVVMVYVAMRFQFKFSFGAVTALAHDVILVLGFFSVLGLDFDLTVLAAVLAVIGYSLNDTIVVSDRIRENFRKLRKGHPEEVINVSLSQTLGRTLITSLTTLLVLVALFLVGGELIHGFSIALIVGVLVGTYSSIYVAANVLLALNISKADLVEPVKEGAEIDEMP